MRIIARAAILGVLLTLTTACALAQSADEFIINVWCGIPDSESTSARYSEMSQAGFTGTNNPLGCGTNSGTVTANRKILDLAQQYGMKAIVSDTRIINADPRRARRRSDACST